MQIEKNLTKKTLRELKDIAFRLDLLPPEGKPKKMDWIGLIADTIRNHPEAVRKCLDPALMEKCRSILETGDTEIDGTEAERFVMSLEALGLATVGARDWLFVPEVKEILSYSVKEMKALKAADHLYVLVRGCVNIFGMVDSNRLGEVVLPGAPEAREALMAIYARRHGLDSLYRENDRVWLMDEDVDDPEHLSKMLSSKMYGETPWPKYTSHELAEAGKYGIPHFFSVFRRIISWMKREHMDHEEMMDTIQDAVKYAQNHDTDQYFFVLESCLDEVAMSPMYQHAEVEALKKIPIWSYRGHTAEDLEQMLAPEKPAPANPGDFCPCGSGMRYRSCCGRMQ